MNFRNDFAILKNSDHAVYLDSAATTLTPDPVLEKVMEYYKSYNANIHRGIHNWAEKATAEYEGVRSIIRDLIRADDDREIVFTSGTTHSINIIANCYCADWNKNDLVVISESEHHANIVPWQQLRDRRSVKFSVTSVNNDGYIDLEILDQQLDKSDGRKLVAISTLPNATGVLQNIDQICEIARSHDATILIDGAQSVPRLPTDVSNYDFLAFSGHKIYGPTGVGVLFARKGKLDDCPPYICGGDMIRTVKFDKTTFNTMPYRYEAGTPNIAGVIGMGEAIKWFSSIGVDRVHEHESEISRYAQKVLNEIDRVELFFPKTPKLGLITFTIKNAQSSDVATMLNAQGIAVRSGFLCAEPILRKRIGRGVLRASFGVYTTRSEIDTLANGLRKTLKIL